MAINKNVVRSVVSNLMNCSSEIHLWASSETHVKQIVHLLLHDRAILFHVDEIKYVFYPHKRSAILFPKYNCSLREYTSLVKEIQLAVDKIAQYTSRAKTTYDKELVIHDLLCSKVTYADEGKHSHSILGPLLEKCGTCDGISKTAKVLFQEAGLASHVVYGRAKSGESEEYLPHAWNLVKANGLWYHIDITFDNTLSRSNIRYDYFNLSTAEITVDHTINTSSALNVVDCVNNNDFYVLNNRFFDSALHLKEYLHQCIGRGEGSVQVRVAKSLSEKDIIKTFHHAVLSAGKIIDYEQSINLARNVYTWSIKYVR